MTKLLAKEISNLLAVRHSEDIFVPQCKNGPTYAPKGELRILDAWAMRRSWSRPCMFGYEIKVSKSDFVADQKWVDYLPLCNQFYFVTPANLVTVAECPPEAGLIWVSTNGKRLYTKKKASHRALQDVPLNLLRYVLICRARIDEERRDPISNLEYWTAWLAQKEEERQVGHRVSRALTQKYHKDVTKVETDNRWLQSEVEKLGHVKQMCETLNINPRYYVSKEMIQEKIDAANTSVPAYLVKGLKTVQSMISKMIEKCENESAS